MKKVLLVVCFIPVFAFSQKEINSKGALKPLELKNGLDSFSYAIGVDISNQLSNQGIKDLNLVALAQAFNDAFKGSQKLLTTEESGMVIQQKFQELSQKKTQEPKIGDMGSVIPDFEQNDVDGKPVNIKSFRGKYVLIDFWASWCGPCRGENPNVVSAFKKYSSKNFTVLGVSLDKSKEPWVQAINNDGLTWTHVSDLKGWTNAVAQKFGINSIPQNFLIDPNGVIIGKNLRGPDLDAKLESVIK
jgi:peroxiredoxin